MLTNPVANGVPARILPDELLAESREGEPVPLTLLRQRPPEKYVLAAGDTLGIYIGGVLGRRKRRRQSIFQIPPTCRRLSVTRSRSERMALSRCRTSTLSKLQG